MSAVNAKVQEPSMEEILASIRRIIADDQTAREGDAAIPEVRTYAPEPAPPAFDLPAAQPVEFDPAPMDASFAAQETQQDDVFDLADHPEFAVAPTDGSDSELTFREDVEPEAVEFTVTPDPEPIAISEPVPTPPPVAQVAPAPLSEPSQMERLISRETDAAVSAAFSNLATTILTSNARTLEDLVGDMLRPMLKSWLDDNLPTIVERLVRAEIERVARGGR